MITLPPMLPSLLNNGMKIKSTTLDSKNLTIKDTMQTTHKQTIKTTQIAQTIRTMQTMQMF
ncbi:hypothetical protein BKH42_05735 [Helicobacter sp. 13S00482-2]|uniref:hypothetical protein n=1 Tax=Helicobacter sp. 13S00482-2 TaxID=1476200 RepID=UPI000BA73918|nr:hypothetical protein [Helicobacter sp. 13S00482-2]PAF53426.1 hypothetical protein BKH42_05735 [Helicobacter sp. 13S00482-2]